MRKFRAASLCAAVAAALVVTVPALATATDTADSGITSVQRARLAERLQLVEQIVRSVEPDLRAGAVAAERRQWLLESLYAMPLEKLRTVGTPAGFGAAVTAMAAAEKVSVKALGDAANDLVYRPIVPCRYIDTRVVPVALPHSYDLGVTGTTGGGSAGCNPVAASGVTNAADFAAISMNVAIVNPLFAPGFLGARPAGSANTTALVNWYQSGPTVQASNAGVVSTAQALGTQIEFFGTQTEIVVDVMGVFTRPGATALDCVTTVTNGGGLTVATGTEFQFFITDLAACPTGYSRVAVACEYGPVSVAGLALITVGAPDSTTGFVTCTWRNDSGGPLNQSNFHTHQRCCRVPGR